MSSNPANPDIRLERPNATASVLIVDGDPQSGRLMLEILARKGILAYLVDDAAAAMEYVDKRVVDAAFIAGAIGSTAGSPAAGLSLLSRIRQTAPELPVVMLGDATPPRDAPIRELLSSGIDTAVDAMRLGCCDFLVKPVDRGRFEHLLDTYLPNHGVAKIAAAREGRGCLFEIIGRSPRMIQCVELAKRVAVTSAPVLIAGESGVGKELIAYLVHYKSRRAAGPYIRVNCAALSDSLLESELFGHEKGAFTGAVRRKLGKFELAHGGTIFLDEIGTITPAAQIKLLQVLQERTFQRVGGEAVIETDVRVIAASNRDLGQMVEQGLFRNDLFYRLNVFPIEIPPLRERREDIPQLTEIFLRKMNRFNHRGIHYVQPQVMEAFQRYSWPGNIRELENLVERACILETSSILTPASFPAELFAGLPLTAPPSAGIGMKLSEVRARAVAEAEKTYLRELLARNGGRINRTAESAGVTVRQISKLLRRYGIRKETYR